MDLNEEICTCMGVSAGDLKAAVESGAKSFEEVQDKTSVSTGCGGCEEKARQIVADFLTK